MPPGLRRNCSLLSPAEPDIFAGSNQRIALHGETDPDGPSTNGKAPPRPTPPHLIQYAAKVPWTRPKKHSAGWRTLLNTPGASAAKKQSATPAPPPTHTM